MRNGKGIQLFKFPIFFTKASEVAGATFSDSDSSPVPKYFNPSPKIFLISESDSCSDSGYRRSKRNLPMFLLKKWPLRLLPLPELKSDSGSGSIFSQIFHSGSERKRQNPAGVDSGSMAPSEKRNHQKDKSSKFREVSISIITNCGDLPVEVPALRPPSSAIGLITYFCETFSAFFKKRILRIEGTTTRAKELASECLEIMRACAKRKRRACAKHKRRACAKHKRCACAKHKRNDGKWGEPFKLVGCFQVNNSQTRSSTCWLALLSCERAFIVESALCCANTLAFAISSNFILSSLLIKGDKERFLWRELLCLWWRSFDLRRSGHIAVTKKKFIFAHAELQ